MDTNQPNTPIQNDPLPVQLQGLDMLSTDALPKEIRDQVLAAMAKQHQNKKARKQTRVSPLLGKLIGRL